MKKEKLEQLKALLIELINCYGESAAREAIDVEIKKYINGPTEGEFAEALYLEATGN